MVMTEAVIEMWTLQRVVSVQFVCILESVVYYFVVEFHEAHRVYSDFLNGLNYTRETKFDTTQFYNVCPKQTNTREDDFVY